MLKPVLINVQSHMHAEKSRNGYLRHDRVPIISKFCTNLLLGELSATYNFVKIPIN